MELKPPNFDVRQGNAAHLWPKFKQNFEIFVNASGIAADENRKCNLLLHCMGSDGIEIYNSFELKQNEFTYDNLITKFNGYFVPKTNLTFERHKFFTRNQTAGESFDAYVTDLKALSATCDFGKLRNSLIKDRIVCGTYYRQ